MAIQYSFERVEKKYLLSEAQARALTKALAPHTEPEEYGLHSVLNIYYDTPRFDLIRRSLEKPVYKEKFRLRCYGVPGAESVMFAEVKKKYRDVVYKRRVAGTPAEIAAFMDGQALPGQDELNQREIRCFLNRWQIAPRAFIAYDREAFLGKNDPGLRVTFDRNLRYRTERLDLRAGDAGELFLPPDQVIMEIKMPLAAPLWLSRMLCEAGILPHSFSKYGTLYTEKLIASRDERNEQSC